MVKTKKCARAPTAMTAGASGPSGAGNTKAPEKRISASKRWTFTLNNWTEAELEELKNISVHLVPTLGFQSEVCPTTLTPHLQGFLVFAHRKRPSQALPWSTRVHWEKMKASVQENITYVTKNEIEIGGWDGNIRYHRGFDAPYRGPQIKLRDWQQTLSDILDECPDDRSIYWIWSKSGNVGKTTFAKWCFHNKTDVIVTGGKADDMKHGVLQYQQTNLRLPKIVIVDIPRVNRGHFSIAGIESIKNMFFYCGKYEGGMVSGRPPHVICFANSEPDYEEMSSDRWFVMCLDDRYPVFWCKDDDDAKTDVME